MTHDAGPGLHQQWALSESGSSAFANGVMHHRRAADQARAVTIGRSRTGDRLGSPSRLNSQVQAPGAQDTTSPHEYWAGLNQERADTDGLLCRQTAKRRRGIQVHHHHWATPNQSEGGDRPCRLVCEPAGPLHAWHRCCATPGCRASIRKHSIRRMPSSSKTGDCRPGGKRRDRQELRGPGG